MAKIRFSKKLHFFIFVPFICWFSLFTALDRVIFPLLSSENLKLKFLKKKIYGYQKCFHSKNSIFQKNPFFIFAPFICWFSLFTALDKVIFLLSSSENQKLKFLKVKKIRLSEEFPWQKFVFQKKHIFFLPHIFVGFLFLWRWIE